MDKIKVEEDRNRERMERWDRVVAVYKKKSEQPPSTKPPTTSRKGGSSAPPATSLQTQEQSTEEHTSKEISEKINPMGETSPEERLKK